MRIQRIHATVQLPRYAHATDAGMDLYLPETLALAPNERRKVALGFACALPHDSVGRILEKSSRANEGLKLLGGVIDEGYRGEVQMIVWNTNTTTLKYSASTPIAQLVIYPVLHPTVEEAASLDETARGSGGFGSTHTQVNGQWQSRVS